MVKANGLVFQQSMMTHTPKKSNFRMWIRRRMEGWKDMERQKIWQWQKCYCNFCKWRRKKWLLVSLNSPTNSSQSDTLLNNIYKEQGKDPFYSDFVLRSIFTILWPSTLITFLVLVPNLFPPRTLHNWWVTESCVLCDKSNLTSISSIAGTWSASSDN